MTRRPICTPSRSETCALTVESSPTVTPAPSTACASITTRSPIRQPGPITAKGPTCTSTPSVAVGSMAACGLMPGAGRGAGARIATASAQARYGSRVRSIAHGAAFVCSSTMPAEARVVGRRAAYLGLARNVRSPGPASSREATDRMSMVPSPSRRQPSRSASSASFTAAGVYTRPSGALIGYPLDERCETFEAERFGRGGNARGADVARLTERVGNRGQMRRRLDGRLHARGRAAGAAHREVVTNGAEGEVPGDEVGTGNEEQERAG